MNIKNISSNSIFDKHFCSDSISAIVEGYVSAHTARGVDGVTYEKFLERKTEETDLIVSRIRNEEYRFSPYRQKLIIKDAFSPPRQVSIPTIRDRVALRALNNFLYDAFPSCKPQHSHPVVSSAINAIKVATSDQKFIKLDLKRFYDCIDHQVLMKVLSQGVKIDAPLKAIHSAIKTPTGATVASNAVNPVGVPQGLSISNMLASIYLRDIDAKYSGQLGVDYHRYVDDILVIADGNEVAALFKSISGDLKRRRKLQVHPLGSGKSEIIPINGSLSYLGYAFEGDLVSVKLSNQKKLLTNLLRIINTSDRDNPSRAIWRLNIRISGCRLNGDNIGWMFYFSQINDVKLLAKFDARIRKAIVSRFGAAEYKRCKRFVRAYYEVKHSAAKSNYFFDFDKCDREEMIKTIIRLSPKGYNGIELKDDASIRRIFFWMIQREVRELENDTLGSFS